MKIIISHDVDHIDVADHFFKDLILGKMFVRSLFQLITGKISLKTCLYRQTMVFRRRMNRIDEVMAFDKRNNIPSIFFFGMSNLLGMSYSRKKAAIYISKVIAEGIDVGVHGCDYINYENIKKEYDEFKRITKNASFGIRNHYVRFDENTFEKMERAGYLFDSSYYYRHNSELLDPYRVGKMWEFPLHIMDCHVCTQGKLQKGIDDTINIIKEADKKGLKYCTILFHDYQFDDAFDPQMKKWYEEIISFCKKSGFTFVSYREAIEELEHEYNKLCK